jgi:hypothetical protein
LASFYRAIPMAAALGGKKSIARRFCGVNPQAAMDAA